MLVVLAVGLLVAACGEGEDGADSDATEVAEPVEFAIYGWEPNIVPKPGAADPAAEGFSSRSDAEALAAGDAIVVRDTEGGDYFVIRDKPGLTAADITGPEQVTDPLGDPAIRFDFTPLGQEKFQALTRTAARSGGHFAIVADGEVLSLPIVDPKQSPNGIDGENGASISGGFSVAEAQELADRLAAAAD